MREIKFRIKVKDEYSDGWDYAEMGKSLHWKFSTDSHEPKTIGQFTGLKDSKGKEIYEGDILQLDDGGIDRVHWDKDRAQFMVWREHPKEISDDELWEFNLHSEIIGNIYENKELTKETK